MNSYIFPHTPVLIPEIGGGNTKYTKRTLNSISNIVKEIDEINPDTIIITSPHGNLFTDYIYISSEMFLEGDFDNFTDEKISLRFTSDLELVNAIVGMAMNEDIMCGGMMPEMLEKFDMSNKLDHGTLVPLYFIGNKYKIVSISTSYLDYETLYKFGTILNKAASSLNRKIVWIASGELAHFHTEDEHEFLDLSMQFDKKIIDIVKSGQREKMFSIGDDFTDAVGQCGFRSFMMMFGSYDGYDIETDIFSYEHPFGVGYLVAKIRDTGKNRKKHIVKELHKKYIGEIRTIRSNEDEYVKLARHAVETYVKYGIRTAVPDIMPEELKTGGRGVFVNIKSKGILRGSCGSIVGNFESLAEDIIDTAINACSDDEKFLSLTEDELSCAVYSIDVISPLVLIENLHEVDIKTQGIVIKQNSKVAVLFPDMAILGDNVEEMLIKTAKHEKINLNRKYKLYRFHVESHF